jgi:hypothetical protein
MANEMLIWCEPDDDGPDYLWSDMAEHTWPESTVAVYEMETDN